MRGNPSKKKQTYKGLFGKNGTGPWDDRFCCENIILSVLKRKRKGHLYGETERNRCIQTGPQPNISSSISQHRKQLRVQNLSQMADDGMVVNFDISPDAFTIATPKSKSSRWKDRLKAKRAVEHRANRRAIETAEFNIAPTIPPTTSKTRITAVKLSSGNEKPKQKPAPQAVKIGEFASFLWTGNPKVASAVTGDKREEGAANERSNAP